MNYHIIVDVIRNTLLVTGLVITMMIMIEYINIKSSGYWFKKISKSKPKQVLLASILGIIPGCLGGFAAVSLYSHRMISFGALVAMMICASGDEAFIMLALIPKDALLLFGVLILIGLSTGFIIDKIYVEKINNNCNFEIHEKEVEKLPSLFKISSYKNIRFDKYKILIIIGLTIFIVALFAGLLEHSHGEESLSTHSHSNQCDVGHSHVDHSHVHFDFFKERWINIFFGMASIFALIFTILSSKHFIRVHIWDHIIRGHLLPILLWTFGAMLFLNIGIQYLDIEPWLKTNVYFIILIAALIGLIPESGPHLIFLTLYASGMVPFPVLLASSISQDGHTSLPLLASYKSSFIRAKIINALISIIIAGGIQFIIDYTLSR